MNSGSAERTRTSVIRQLRLESADVLSGDIDPSSFLYSLKRYANIASIDDLVEVIARLKAKGRADLENAALELLEEAGFNKSLIEESISQVESSASRIRQLNERFFIAAYEAGKLGDKFIEAFRLALPMLSRQDIANCIRSLEKAGAKDLVNTIKKSAEGLG